MGYEIIKVIEPERRKGVKISESIDFKGIIRDGLRTIAFLCAYAIIGSIGYTLLV